jgi:hypothetical protein
MPLRNPLSDNFAPTPHLPHSETQRRIQAVRGEHFDERQNLLEYHQEAQQRVYRVLDALHLVSRPFNDRGKRVESKIDILEPYRFQSWPFAQHPLWSWYRPPQEAVSLARYSFNKPTHSRETHFKVAEEDLDGWVFPFALGGRKPVSTKDINHNHKPSDLIIAKEPTGDGWRSWIGGMEAYSPQGARILELPERIATGSTISNTYQGGMHSDQAIEGMTAVNHPNYNPAEQVRRLWKIGNVLIERGRLAEPDFDDVLPDEDGRPKPPLPTPTH